MLNDDMNFNEYVVLKSWEKMLSSLTKGYAHAVDWWAVGILIYEMRCGHAPFYDQSQMEMYRKIVECRLAFPAHFKQDE
eukprot:Awhi_evm1s5532